jgi:ABC-type enterochelin transport system permease subunit
MGYCWSRAVSNYYNRYAILVSVSCSNVGPSIFYGLILLNLLIILTMQPTTGVQWEFCLSMMLLMSHLSIVRAQCISTKVNPLIWAFGFSSDVSVNFDRYKKLD